MHTKHCTQGHFSLTMALSVLSMTLNVLSKALNVLRIWFELLHIFLRSASQAQVVPGTDGPGIVAKATKQESFCVTLLLPTLARERTFQDMIGLHFCYWCIVVLWSGLRRSVTLRPTW